MPGVRLRVRLPSPAFLPFPSPFSCVFLHPRWENRSPTVAAPCALVGPLPRRLSDMWVGGIPERRTLSRLDALREGFQTPPRHPPELPLPFRLPKPQLIRRTTKAPIGSAPRVGRFSEPGPEQLRRDTLDRGVCPHNSRLMVYRDRRLIGKVSWHGGSLALTPPEVACT
jgi:hypothetical protein